MNQFKFLDELFPCGANRMAGEVVAISIRIEVQGAFTTLNWKRKACYVNASVNAWHLHRGLCKDLKDSAVYPLIVNDRAIKKLMAAIVKVCYVEASMTERQGFEWKLVIGDVQGSYATAYRLRAPEDVICGITIADDPKGM